jgi:hypothetical protein
MIEYDSLKIPSFGLFTFFWQSCAQEITASNSSLREYIDIFSKFYIIRANAPASFKLSSPSSRFLPCSVMLDVNLCFTVSGFFVKITSVSQATDVDKIFPRISPYTNYDLIIFLKLQRSSSNLYNISLENILIISPQCLLRTARLQHPFSSRFCKCRWSGLSVSFREALIPLLW